MRRWRWYLLLALVALLMLAVIPAQAHGYIVRAIPEDRAVLERPPARLQYWFSEGLEPEFSTLRLRDQNGVVVAEGGVSPDDTALMTLRVPNDLPDGAYIVELRPAFASDGHVIAESRVFFVGEEVGGVAGQGATDAAVPFEVAWKAVTLVGTMLLLGVFTLYALVLVPAWGSSRYPAGWLPPRVMQRLNWIAGLALAIAISGNLVALIQQTMVFFNISFTAALDPNFWGLVRVGSRFGDIWNIRMGVLVLIAVLFGASLALRRSQPQMVRPFWIANAWGAALVLGTHSVLSHAAGSLLWPWVGIGVDWLHALAVGFWTGGLMVLVLVLPVALRPYVGDDRRRALLAALRRFSPVAVAGLAVVVTSGLYSASNWVYTPEDAATTFGLSLAVKLMLVAALIGVGALHHLALRPERYARWSRLTDRVQGFLPTLRMEAGLVLLTLVAVGWLSATPVPVPEFAQREIEVPVQSQTVRDLTVTLALSPGGPGVNTYDVRVERDGQPVDDASVMLAVSHPERAIRGDPQQAELVEEGLYVTAGDEIDRTGLWWTTLDLTVDGGTQRLAFQWQISDEAAVIETRPPEVQNIVALGLLLLVLGWIAAPGIRRGLEVLDLDPASVTIAAGATAIAALFLAVGFVAVQDTQRRAEAQRNPPPQVVNAVLPDQASLDRGRELYTAHCIAWQQNATDFNALLDRLDRLRDDELYGMVVEGWRGLPPCTEDLTESQRWDVVNFFRTLAPSVPPT